jgi:hypothetical protein
MLMMTMARSRTTHTPTFTSIVGATAFAPKATLGKIIGVRIDSNGFI